MQTLAGFSEGALLVAARRGDQRAFELLTGRYRRELHLHCYRMLGSLDDAEDGVQETYVRAWRQLESFEGRAPFRAWLYRIATNVCLRALERRRRGRDTSEGVPWDTLLEPYPDVLLDELTAPEPDPDERLARRETVELAFLAAVRALPPRQRAVLVLREALEFSAGEVAEMLETTSAAVNSALQRARETLERERAAGRLPPRHAPASEAVERNLVERFVNAWQAVDVEALVALLAEDAVIAMPPGPDVAGRSAIREFLATVPAGGRLDRLRLVPAPANRQPAVAAYALLPEGTWAAYGIMVFTVRDSEIATISGFADPVLFARFGLPLSLDD